MVQDVRPSSRTSPSTCPKIRYSSRSDTVAIMPDHWRPPITAAQRPVRRSGTPHALSGLDRRADALAVLAVAEQTADGCEAFGLRDEVTRELRRLGRKVSRPTRRGQPGAGIDALSGRQRQIAELAAEGLTNREIAATLYLSEKTIERHLSVTFAKLGVPSRAALAAQLVSA